MEIQKILKFIDKQIRSCDRKINNIVSIKEEKRCLSEKERRTIKYLIGKRDECLIIKRYINNIEQNVIQEIDLTREV